MAVCLNEMVALYKVDIKSGKMDLCIKQQADFSEKDPCVNQCILNNGVLVTGGDDKKVRIFAFKSRDFNEFAK